MYNRHFIYMEEEGKWCETDWKTWCDFEGCKKVFYACGLHSETFYGKLQY